MKLKNKYVQKKKWQKPDITVLSVLATKNGGPDLPPETILNESAS